MKRMIVVWTIAIFVATPFHFSSNLLRKAIIVFFH
jgi:hypothetical protein